MRCARARRSPGARVDVAADGKEALEQVALLPYDLIFARGWGGGLPGRPARGGVPRGRVRARHPPRAASDAVRILMVDDDPAARMALGELLEHAGHEVVTATGG